MYADVADYAEYRFDTSSTGLVFSSSSMAQKFGGALGGSIVTAILAAYGYDTAAGAVQSQGALECVKVLMSFLPAAVALISLLFMVLYPLNKNKMEHIQNYLIIHIKNNQS